MKLSKNVDRYLKVILGLFSMALAIYISTTIFQRVSLDFTEEKLYTLSSGTKSILSKLDSSIRLRLYYSKTAANRGTEGLRAFNNHYVYVQELLRQYVSLSKNNLSLEVIDPRPDTSDEEDALAYGLKKFNITETESYFFGLVAENESGAEKVIEFFDPSRQDRIEYDITKLIYTTLNPQRKTIGIISPLNVVVDNSGGPYMEQLMRMQGKRVESSWISIKMLEEFYTIKKIANDVDEISAVDTLVVIHPRGFPPKTLFAIDQYLLRGGNLLVLVDPNAIVDRSTGMYGGMSSSPDEGFKKLLDNWGIDVRLNTFAGDKYLSGVGRVSPNRPAERLIAVLNCTKKCSEGHLDGISSGIDNATFVFPGVLAAKDKKGVAHTAILSTSDRGGSYTASPYEVNNPSALWNKFTEEGGPLAIGLKALGKFSTAFPQGLVDDKGKKKKNNKKNKDILRNSTKEAAVVVIADVDFIGDQFAFKNTFLGPAVSNDNSSLFLNSVEALAGDIDLLSVRSKRRMNRSFDVINSIELESERKTADKVREINASIAGFQNELNKLGSQAHEGNIALLQNEGIRKKKELTKRIALLKKDLRTVKRHGREKIERIGKFVQYLNTMAIPIIVIALGTYYVRKRGYMIKGRRNHPVVTS